MGKYTSILCGRITNQGTIDILTILEKHKI